MIMLCQFRFVVLGFVFQCFSLYRCHSVCLACSIACLCAVCQCTFTSLPMLVVSSRIHISLVRLPWSHITYSKVNCSSLNPSATFGWLAGRWSVCCSSASSDNPCRRRGGSWNASSVAIATTAVGRPVCPAYCKLVSAVIVVISAIFLIVMLLLPIVAALEKCSFLCARVFLYDSSSCVIVVLRAVVLFHSCCFLLFVMYL